MKSMTGYGLGTATDDAISASVEISSVNRRTLDITTSLPADWQGMERELVGRVRQWVERGKINIRCRIEQAREGALDWDNAAVRDVITRLRALAENEGIAFHPDADFLLRLVVDIGTPARNAAEPGVGNALIMRALDTALEGLIAMRGQEGAALKVDFLQRLEILGQAVGRIRERTPDGVAQYRDALLQRLRKSGLEWDLDDERVLREVAVFADRCDIAEEITRLDSHLAQFHQTLEAAGPVGRKLDFLCQEIHREINTIASKSNQLDVIQETLECRNELERLREQVQNVE